jgi:hypothetical protein
MPNRYEREIEEILRNMEQTEPKAGFGQRWGGRWRQRPGPRRPKPQSPVFSFHFSVAEWLLITTVIAALIAGGYEFVQKSPDLFSAFVALVGVVCLILVALSQFLFVPRRPQSTRYGNITVTPLRPNLFSNIRTQWNLFMLKMRYRRKNKN